MTLIHKKKGSFVMLQQQLFVEIKPMKVDSFDSSLIETTGAEFVAEE